MSDHDNAHIPKAPKPGPKPAPIPAKAPAIKENVGAIGGGIGNKPIVAVELSALMKLKPADIVSTMTYAFDGCFQGGVFDAAKYATWEKSITDVVSDLKKFKDDERKKLGPVQSKGTDLLKWAKQVVECAKDPKLRGLSAIVKLEANNEELRKELEKIRDYPTDYKKYKAPRVADADAEKGEPKHRAIQVFTTGAAQLLDAMKALTAGIDENEAKKQSLFANDTYAKETYKTAWNEPITFSWEREGNDDRILELYAPDFASLKNKSCHGAARVTIATAPVADQPALQDLWNTSVGGGLPAIKDMYKVPPPPPAIWKVVRDKYPTGLTLADWQALSTIERRAFMMANGLYYKDLRKMAWNDLSAKARVMVGILGSPDSKNRRILGTALLDDMHPVLESEVSDSDPYRNFAWEMAHEEIVQDNYKPNPAQSEHIKPRTWEMKHGSYTDDLKRLYFEIGLLASTLGGTIAVGSGKEMPETLDVSEADANIQLHVVCKRPADKRDVWAPKFSGLALMLNDRGAAHDWSQKADDVHTKFLGPFLKEDKGELDEILKKDKIPYVVLKDEHGVKKWYDGATDVTNVAGDGVEGAVFYESIEVPDNENHQIGRWKFGVVSLRHHYGNAELFGFEIRSSTDPTLKDTLRNLCKALQGWTDWNKTIDQDKSMINLVGRNGYEIAELAAADHMGKDACNAMSATLQDLMSRAAGAAPKQPWELVGGLLYKRWAFPYVSWETHPAVIANGGPNITATIQKARAAFATEVAKIDPSKPVEAQTIVEREVKAFFAMTQLWKFF